MAFFNLTGWSCCVTRALPYGKWNRAHFMDMITVFLKLFSVL